MVWEGAKWPPVNMASDLRDWMAQTRALLAGLSRAERGLIAAGNARSLYRV